jgi:hypothetical protein
MEKQKMEFEFSQMKTIFLTLVNLPPPAHTAYG